MIYSQLITLKKLKKMMSEPKNWKVVVRNNLTDEENIIRDIDVLKQYLFSKDYSIGYDFIGDWNTYHFDNYTFNKEYVKELHYSRKIGDVEIFIKEVDRGITAELVKWENDSPTSEDLPSCFVLGYWSKTSEGYKFQFVLDRPFEYIDSCIIGDVWESLKICQNILNTIYNTED